MLPLHFLYRKVSPEVAPIANMARFRAEVLSAFATQTMMVEVFWTSEASDLASFEPCDHLVASGVMSTGHGAASREVLVEGGRYWASLGGFSVASTTAALKAHRPSRSQSIENGIEAAFAMQLDRTLSILIRRAGEKPKRDGPAIRDALSRHIAPALQLYSKTGPDADRDGQAVEHMKRFAHDGRTAFRALFDTVEQAEQEVRYDGTLRPGDLRDLLTEDTFSVLRHEADPIIQRELVLLIVLAKLRVLAMTVNGAHRAIQQDPDGQALNEQPVEHIVRNNRYGRHIPHELVERPHQLLSELETIAAISFVNPMLHEPYLFLLLAIEVASRYEVDILELFPSRATFRPITQAAIAIARCRRRGVLPRKNSHHAFRAFWGLRAMLDGEPRLEPMREPIRAALDAIPEDLVKFALFGERPTYFLSETEMFRN